MRRAGLEPLELGAKEGLALTNGTAPMSAVGALDSPRGSWQFNQSRTPLQRWYLRQVRKDGQVVDNTVLGDLGMQG